MSLTAIATVAVAGAILGDAVSFWVGRYFGDRILKLGVFRRRRREVERALQAVRDHGGSAVLFARFTAFLRAVMPGLAGIARMPYRRFFVFNAMGGLIWPVGLTLLGFAAGASYKRVESVAGTASKGVLVAVALAVLVFLSGDGAEHAIRLTTWLPDRCVVESVGRSLPGGRHATSPAGGRLWPTLLPACLLGRNRNGS